jgi:hypothetical protein
MHPALEMNVDLLGGSGFKEGHDVHSGIQQGETGQDLTLYQTALSSREQLAHVGGNVVEIVVDQEKPPPPFLPLNLKRPLWRGVGNVWPRKRHCANRFRQVGFVVR